MSAADVEQVIAIAASLKDAPHWRRSVYVSALNPETSPQRIALVAEETQGETSFPSGAEEKHASGAKTQPPSGSVVVRAEALTYHSELTDRSGGSQVDGESEGGRVVGFLIAGLLAPHAELESIAVSEAEQRRGMGRKLFFAMVKEMEMAGVREVLLEVRASNQRALDFYRCLGWVETGRRPRYYADPEEDAVQMSLKLE